MADAKIVGIENSVYGKPMLIKETIDGSLLFEPLPIGITRLERIDKSTSAFVKLPSTEHSHA
jgi:hypothetical protein